MFADAQDLEKIMLVKVNEAGESCADTDKYIQSISLQNVASLGMTMQDNLILKPEVPLIVGIAVLLVVFTAGVLIGVGYCLRKGWPIKKAQLQGFRTDYTQLDIDHLNE